MKKNTATSSKFKLPAFIRSKSISSSLSPRLSVTPLTCSSLPSISEEFKCVAPQAASSYSDTSITDANETREPTREEIEFKRNNIITEIVVSERVYVKCLERMLVLYKEALKTRMHIDDITAIFSVAENIYDAHCELLAGLEERFAQWHENILIGCFFLQKVIFLRTYSVYTNQYTSIVNLLSTACETDALISKLLSDVASAPNIQTLYSYLIMPVQRIPRYILLFQDLARHTPVTHGDYNYLLDTIRYISEIADYIDNKRSVYDRANKLASLSMSIDRVPHNEDIVCAGRVFILEGELFVRDTTITTPSTCFLFNDALYVTKKHSRAKPFAFSLSTSTSVTSSGSGSGSPRKHRRGSFLSQQQTHSHAFTYTFVEKIPLSTSTQLTNYTNQIISIGSIYFRVSPTSISNFVDWLSALSKIVGTEYPQLISPSSSSSSSSLCSSSTLL
jgi:hypothetical protein